MLNQTEVPKKHTLPSLLNLDHVSSVKTPSKPSNYKPTSLLTPAHLSAKHSRNVSPYNAKTPGKTPAPTPANKSMSPKSKASSIQHEEPAVNSSRLKDMNNKTLRQARQCLESRPLKKLYTASMHQQYTGKLDDLKRKYDHVYKYVVKDQPEILDPSRERIKDVVLKSENLFNTTYSIKYFGVKDDQIGILSKRVNMNQKNTARQNRTTEIERRPTGDNRPSILIDKTYQGPSEGFQRHEGTLTNFGNSNTTPKHPGSSKNKLKSITQGIRDYDRQERATHQESSLSKDEGLISRVKNARRSLEVSVPGEDDYFKNYSQNVYGMIPQHITESEHESLEGMMHTQGASFGSKEVNRQFEDPEERQEEAHNNPGTNRRNVKVNELYGYEHGNKEATAFLTAKSPDGYMITKYVLPKKLQAPKRVERTGRKLTGLQKMVKAPEEDNYHHFERNLKSLPKVKRTLLRSLDAKGQVEEYKDDLNAVEKFRTNELNNLIAGVTKYSYSKLLETLAFGPFGVEKVFEEKNKNLEEVFKTRKQKKAVKNADLNVNASTGRMSKGSSTVNGWFKDKIDEIEEMYTHAENFDLKVECDGTEMLNTYLKVRNGIK